jgi:integrase
MKAHLDRPALASGGSAVPRAITSPDGSLPAHPVRSVSESQDSRSSSTVPATTKSARARRVPGQQGSIRRLPTGQWQARLPARLGAASIGTYGSRPEATRRLARAIVEVEDGTRGRASQGPRGAKMATVAEVVKRYIDDSDERLAHHTLRCYRSAMAVRIAPQPFGAIRIDRLTTPAITAWRDDLITAGHSTHSVRYAVALLSAAYGAAAGRVHLPANPVLALPRQSRTKRSGAARAEAAARRAAVPSWADMSAILSAIPHREDRLMTLLLAWAGARFTEAASLNRVNGVHPNRPAVHIDRVIVRGRKTWVQESPKTGERRDVQIPQPLWEALRQHSVALPPAVGDRWDVALPAHGRGLIYRGGPGIWTPPSWRRVVWHDATSAAGVAGMPVKRLRAHAATVLCASGATVIDAQAHLGHASLSTTQAHYLVAVRAISEDRAIADLRAIPRLTLQERLDTLWARFVEQHGDPL